MPPRSHLGLNSPAGDDTLTPHEVVTKEVMTVIMVMVMVMITVAVLIIIMMVVMIMI